MQMAAAPDAGPTWLVALDNVVIGDCGAYSWPGSDGVVEIGYGLAEPYRGRGFASEAAKAMCAWLFTDAGATVITATGISIDNLASRRVLEKVGFALVSGDDLVVGYELRRAACP
jgi:RimJ/RimL family protein N-acetyltransferase